MPRKRDTLEGPDDLLRRVITDLESDDPTRHRAAVLALLKDGPLQTNAALQKELEQPAVEHWDIGDVPVTSIAAREFLAFLRQAVRLRHSTALGNPIWLTHPVQFFAKDTRPFLYLVAEGTMRDMALLQFLALLERVGLYHVRECVAEDCAGLFVKNYRRQFCSLRCQQRTLKRRSRDIAREHDDRKTRRRRQLRVVKGRQ